MRILIAAAAAFTFAQTAAAQDSYPDRSITMIVPFAAGGTSDVIARLIAEQLGTVLGQRVINENIAGAGGATGLTRAAKSKADGYTIAIGNVGTNAAAYTIYPELQYTPSSFISAGLIAKTVPAIAIKKDWAIADAQAFIAYAKANPGKLTLGHAGVGSSNYIICKQFLAATKIDVTLMSYRGAGPALNDLMAGHIDGVCDTATSLSGAIQGGTVRGLVVATEKRLPTLPDVPTAIEAGLPDFQGEGWNAIFVPKDTPASVLTKLTAALRKASENTDYRKRISDLSAVVATQDEQDTAFVARLVTQEVDKYRKLLTEPGK